MEASLEEIESQFFAPQFFVNFFKNFYRLPEMVFGGHVQGMFSKVPAIICGAGPSLDAHLESLKKMQDGTLILAAGHALQPLCSAGIFPHFGFAKGGDFKESFKLSLSGAFEVPFFFEIPAVPSVFNALHGRKLYLWGRDPLSRFVAKALKQEKGFFLQDGYGSSMAEIAKALGCAPLFFLGFDSCQDERVKHPLELAFTEEKEVHTWKTCKSLDQIECKFGVAKRVKEALDKATLSQNSLERVENTLRSSLERCFSKGFCDDIILEPAYRFVLKRIQDRFPNEDVTKGFAEKILHAMEIAKRGETLKDEVPKPTRSPFPIRGDRIFHYPNGNIRSLLPFRNGVLHGLVRLYYPQGQKKRVVLYKNGLLHGKDESFGLNGNLTWQTSFQDGKFASTLRGWYVDGSLACLVTFEDGKPHTIERWDRKGEKLAKLCFETKGPISTPSFQPVLHALDRIFGDEIQEEVSLLKSQVESLEKREKDLEKALHDFPEEFLHSRDAKKFASFGEEIASELASLDRILKALDKKKRQK